MVSQKVWRGYFLSFLRKQESSLFRSWNFLDSRFHGNDDFLRNYLR